MRMLSFDDDPKNQNIYALGVQWLAWWTLTHTIGARAWPMQSHIRYALNSIQFRSDESSAKLVLHVSEYIKCIAPSTLFKALHYTNILLNDVCQQYYFLWEYDYQYAVCGIKV